MSNSAVSSQRSVCPHCKKGEIHVHPGGRMCGCDTCFSIFRYPSMVPFPVLPTVETEGEPNQSALANLAEYVAEVSATEVVKVRTNHFAGKYIATFSDEVPS